MIFGKLSLYKINGVLLTLEKVRKNENYSLKFKTYPQDGNKLPFTQIMCKTIP